MLALVWLGLGTARVRYNAQALLILLVDMVLAADLIILKYASELTGKALAVRAKFFCGRASIGRSVIIADACRDASESAIPPDTSSLGRSTAGYDNRPAVTNCVASGLNL